MEGHNIYFINEYMQLSEVANLYKISISYMRSTQHGSIYTYTHTEQQNGSVWSLISFYNTVSLKSFYKPMKITKSI